VHWIVPLVRVARSRNLRRIGLGFLVFNVAEWGTWVAILVYAYGHGGATASGVVGGVLLLPAALAAPGLAVLADRYPPAWSVLGGYVAQGSTILLVAGAIAAGAPSLVVYAIALVYSATIVISRPAQAALLPLLTDTPDELTATYVVAGWMETGALVVGPGVAGILLRAHGVSLVFLTFGALSILSALPILSLTGVRRPAVTGAGDEAPARLLPALRDALAIARTSRGIGLLVGVLSAGAVLLGALDVLYVQLAIHDLGMGQGGAGFLNAAFGVGAVAAGAGTVLLIGRRRLIAPLYLGVAVAGAALLLLALGVSRPGAVVAMAGTGAGQALLNVTGRTFLQRITPEDALGRVFGILEGVWYGGQGLGALLVPGLIALGGTRGAVAGIGLILPLAGAAAFRTLRALDATGPDRSAVIALLHRYPPFALIRPPGLETLAAALEHVGAPAGEVVIREGDPGDRFYLIASGEAIVTRNGTELRRLGKGEGFGEIALLRNQPRSATVTASSELVLWSLASEPFLLAVTGHAAAARAVEELVAELVGR
jgi:MFS family permease